MDAHTLNAWTRFALQKGGIGSCTALIDNPATDLEDLMFMAGEKIVVLRRLEEDSGDAGLNRRRSGSGASAESDQWYLGYCEGVVGRFRGAHVQFQGKLKKPVLMRRSGVGAIRESTLRPMSKSEAANLHASQVPPGIPFTAVDSDEEDNYAAESSKSSSAAQDTRDTTVDRSVASQQSGARYQDKAAPLAHKAGLAGKMTRLGVTTPPLSDETHARLNGSSRRPSANAADDSDSDDESDTHLPWARASTSSNKSVASVDRGAASLNNTMAKSYSANGAASVEPRLHSQFRGPPATARVANLNMSNTLPPSPISSAESPLNSKGGENGMGMPPSGSFEGVIPRIRAPGLGHTPNQSSIETMTTESEEDGRRPDHTLSIYEIYGRDSVAFPNFDFRALNGNGVRTASLGARMATSKSNESDLVSRSTPVSPLIPGADGRDPSGRSPTAVRAPSHRRPLAAPPLGPSHPASNRKPDSADQARLGSSGSTSNAAAFGTFDPRRRPSMGNLNRLRQAQPRNQAGAEGNGLPSGAQGDAPPMPPSAAMAQGPSHPAPPMGSNLLARRMQESGLAAASSNGRPTPAPIHINTNVSSPVTRSEANSDGISSPNRPFAMAAAGALPSPSAMAYKPARSSSDRTSHRERIGSGQLKKNTSNPQAGPHGGMSALMIPTSQNGASTTPSRSPSPLSATSPGASMGRSVSPGGPMTRSGPPASAGPLSASPNGIPPPGNARLNSPQLPSPGAMAGPRNVSSPVPQLRMMTASPGPRRNFNPANVSFDAMGFVTGVAPPIPVPNEDPEMVKAWKQILSENDVSATKKSRKVRRMVQKGIPHSMRKTVWPFLANAYVRHRPGLFEELCKVSLSAKGKKGKEAVYDAIEKDLHRAYPDHRLFMGEDNSGMADLEAILKAYAHYNPLIGYTQGMNLVAGFLLIQMPAEDAFWLMCGLLRDVHMEGYYSGDMKQLHVDGIVFGQLLQSMDAQLAARLIELSVEPINFAPNWLLPLFARVLPWQTLLCAWDMFFFEGPSWILRLALAIIRILRDPLMDKRVCPGPGEALRLLLHPPQHLLTPDNVIPCALSVKLKDGDVRKLSRQASKLVRSTVLNPSGPRGRPNSGGIGAATARSASAPPVKRQQASSS